ncbi:HNH endonuclease [Microbacterium sp. Root61]|uniref:HNH endonuclease signature motif containing protein n=1 Tax=Microbacterium sp. Root61 TaxID=1736570 RepID=UPI0006F9EF31|nr:HNH endonuclease signature motif containing protein [Microbacterium sp. Root61]KRA23611.1 HNH endonuclease [Microbacterium sp. Root61]
MSSTVADEGLPPGDDGWVPPFPDALDLVVEAEAMLAVFAAHRYVRIDALHREALADAATHGYLLTDVIERSVRLELAAALSITESAAGLLVMHADALVHRYPGVLDSLEGARMSARHATELVDLVDTVEPDLRGQVLEQAIGLAEAHAFGTFRRKLRILVDSVRAATLAERHEQALQQRRVAVTPAEDGMAWFMLFGPAVEVHAIHGRLTAIAKVLTARDDETRTLDQVRADVCGDLLIDGTTDGTPADARGVRATVVVTVPALTLLGDDDGQATVEGLGPIPLARARELCGSAEGWMRVLTHPETGMVLSVGRERYRPPPELRRLVRWRAERCMAPGCGIPAARCEIDHTVAWEHGGTTELSNLAPLCKGHHTIKHHGRWRVHQIADSGGALEWTSPTGRHYRVDPERKVPTFTPSSSEGSMAPF